MLNSHTQFFLVPENSINSEKEVLLLPSLPFFFEGFLTEHEGKIIVFGKNEEKENVIYTLDLEKIEQKAELPQIDISNLDEGEIEKFPGATDEASNDSYLPGSGVGDSSDITGGGNSSDEGSSGGDDTTTEGGIDDETEGSTETPLKWKFLTNKDIYIPTVMTDCKCSNGGLSDFSSAPGEAYNRLSNLCKIEYSSVNRDSLDISKTDSTHEMRYYIPNVAKEDSEKILSDFSVKITYPEALKDANGNDLKDENGELVYSVTHKFAYFNGKATFYEIEPSISAVTDSSDALTKDKYKNKQPDGVWIAGWIRPDGSMRLSFLSNTYVVTTGLKAKTVTAADYFRNNMIITMPCTSENGDEIKDEIFNSDISTWYGGEASGIFGGTRLFVAGSTNKVIWTDLNNPLYFPEDCDMDVGERDEKITAFGKQNEQLVIFKERSVWGSNYAFNSNITGENLINQTEFNYEANVAYFPLIQLHPNIGCRVPGSIQLCRNRLVWADLGGKVYTLVSQSQYSERNVYQLSGMIENKLKRCDEKAFKNATSADFEGYYILCVGNQFFVMDYDSYGYSHCYSYSKNEDGQKLIPWWYWEISLKETENIERIFTINQDLYYVLCDADQKYNALGPNFMSKNFGIYHFTDSISTDAGKTFSSMIKTKSFSFGTMQYLKHISALNIALNGSGEVRVTYFGSKPEHEQEEIFSLYSDTLEPYSPYYMQNIFLRPNMRFMALFGVRLESDSSIAIGPISLNYRLLGGNK